MLMTTRITVPVLCLIAVLMTASLWAAEESATELAKKGFGNEKRKIPHTTGFSGDVLSPSQWS
jgi:hypothetical protein